MFYKKSLGEKVFDFLNYIFLILLVFVTLYPFLYVLMASLSDPRIVVQDKGFYFWPKGFTIDTYKYVFDNPMILIGYKNTLFYVIVGTCINMLLTSLGAYALSRKYLLGGTSIMMLIVFTMFFQGGLIPMYLNIKNLGILNTVWPILLVPAMNTFNLIVMRTAFQAVPDSMEESAKIDGANDFVILFRIFIPLSLPVMAVMVLFYSVQHWNSWFHAMIYLRDRDLYPVQLILREILIANDTSSMTTDSAALDQAPLGETVKYATIMIVTLPILFVYPFLQKYFAKGIMIGAVKG